MSSNRPTDSTPPDGMFFDGIRTRTLIPQPSRTSKRLRILPSSQSPIASDHESLPAVDSPPPVVHRTRLRRAANMASSPDPKPLPDRRQRKKKPRKATDAPWLPTPSTPITNDTRADTSTDTSTAIVTTAAATHTTVTGAAATPTTDTGADSSTAVATDSTDTARQLMQLRKSLEIDSSYSLEIRIDFNRGGTDKISHSNMKMFDNQFDTMKFSDCSSSFSKVVFPAILKYMDRVYGTEKKQYGLWKNPNGKHYIYVRADKLDVKIKKRGQIRRSTRKIEPFNVNFNDVDVHWMDILAEKGANLYAFSPCTPSEAAKTTHEGAVIGFGNKIIVFDIMIPMSTSKRVKENTATESSHIDCEEDNDDQVSL